ncbi:MAG: 3-oxoacyl-[acyl-carrier protein] reductase [Solirubrobacteraceae bacterium]|jgi:3-oxoacyl-[acyl-carrier protein] reductase|nr:3-oxoacyl-[acyl-carrier protein] reductase [Solirubrobacteraceae bacterium]
MPVSMDLGLAGRACVVTGGSRGIGLATARALCAEGASVVLVARDAGALTAAADALTGAGGRAIGLALDVTEPDAGERIVSAAQEAFGPLHALVNNAGATGARPLEELTDADWQAQWDVHVMASLRLMRAAAPGMAERGEGRIVNVVSSAARRPSGTLDAAYSVTKAAQLSLSRVFADRYAAQGVLVNAVAPGAVAGSMWLAEGGLADEIAARTGRSREEVLESTGGRVPQGRMGTEDEVGAVVAFLCSAQAAFVAGAAWAVDGGAVPTNA